MENLVPCISNGSFVFLGSDFFEAKQSGVIFNLIGVGGSKGKTVKIPKNKKLNLSLISVSASGIHNVRVN